MLATWSGHPAIDKAKLGLFGFSIGGFTALTAIGGVADLSTVPGYCVSHAASYVCSVLKEHPGTEQIKRSDWLTDPRIEAAVVVAPALDFTFSKAGLSAVHVPIQLWRAGDDHILPSAEDAAALAADLPQPPEYHVVPNADRFDFLAPCTEDLARFVPMICQERGAFDRAAFHRTLNADIVRFFETALHLPQADPP